MVPKIAKAGRSFKGAASYYLHDKKARTDSRVAFTYTLNLPTDNPALAWKVMAAMAINQDFIKRKAGTKATGRKLTKPVYSFSLSWHPDESPDPDAMIGAAQQALEVLGMEDAQALLIAHNDERHPHIHVIVNRVDVETGKAFSTSNDRLKLSHWAEEYERQHGKIYCEQRVTNNEQRSAGAYIKYEQEQDQADHHRCLEVGRQDLTEAFEQEAGSPKKKAPLANLLDRRSRELITAHKQVKEHFRPIWRELYRRQTEEQAALEQNMTSITGRVRYLLANRRWLGVGKGFRGLLSAVFTAMAGRSSLEESLTRRHAEERRLVRRRADQMLARLLAEASKTRPDPRERLESGRQQPRPPPKPSIT